MARHPVCRQTGCKHQSPHIPPAQTSFAGVTHHLQALAATPVLVWPGAGRFP